MTEKQIEEITMEAIKIMRDYPDMSMKEAIEKAKEVTKYESRI